MTMFYSARNRFLLSSIASLPTQSELHIRIISKRWHYLALDVNGAGFVFIFLTTHTQCTYISQKECLLSRFRVICFWTVGFKPFIYHIAYGVHPFRLTIVVYFVFEVCFVESFCGGYCYIFMWIWWVHNKTISTRGKKKKEKVVARAIWSNVVSTRRCLLVIIAWYTWMRR